MRFSRNPLSQVALVRKWVTGVTTVEGEVLCADANHYGVVGVPASVNDYSESFGTSTEAVTYSSTMGSGGNVVEIEWDPFGIFKGRVVGGTAADTAFAEKTDGNLLTATATSNGIVITDADVGTSSYVQGYAVCLSGGNKGQARIITSQSNNTSTTVNDPFDVAFAVGDTFLRTFGPGNQGLELTTNYVQFNGDLAAGETVPDSGYALVWDVLVDKQPLGQSLKVRIDNPTAPFVEVEFFFLDSAFNSLA